MKPKKLGQKVRTAHEARNLKQWELAEMVGRPRIWITKIEAGAHRIYAEDLGKLAEKLELPIEYFY